MAYLKVTKIQGCAVALLLTALGFPACAIYAPKSPDIPPTAISVMGQEVSPEMIARGAELYAANCQACHGGATGGTLKDIPPPHNANGHTWHHADQQIMNMVLNGISFSLEEQKMPSFQGALVEEEVEDISAYMKTWWTKKQLVSQQEVTRQWNQ